MTDTNGEKVAVVIGVGASRGTGAAVARRFAREGYHVYLGARSGERLEAVAKEIGRDAVFLRTDVSDYAEVVALTDAAVERFGTDGLDTEQHAREYAAQQGMFYLSPYNDEAVVAGQGTIGVEILEQMPEVEVVFIAVGGGGLIGGVGSVLKDRDRGIRVVGCQPLASPVMSRSVEAGRILDVPSEPTLSDGTAGGIEADSVTFALNRAVVDDWVEVDEERIAAAMKMYMDSEGDVIEGAAGVAIAGVLERAADVAGKKVVVVVCGGNVSEEVLASVR